jgi:hypothetical protein
VSLPREQARGRVAGAPPANEDRQDDRIAVVAASA